MKGTFYLGLFAAFEENTVHVTKLVWKKFADKKKCWHLAIQIS